MRFVHRFLLYPLFIATCFLILPVQKSHAQYIPIGDPFEEYVRFLYPDDAPSFNIRPISWDRLQEEGFKGHPWEYHSFFQQEDDGLYEYGIYSPEQKTTWNSRVPSGQNDGALWQGRGFNNALSLGGYFDVGPLKISLRPEIVYSQNKSYDGIRRFGNRPYSRFDLGKSSVELHYKGFATGMSNQNLWSGPAVQNPILFSNNAPGFLHGFAGTYRPVRTPIGAFEGRLIFGGLRESKFYDENPNNNLRYINAIIFNYSPSFISGLHLGFTRFYMQAFPKNGLTFSDLFVVTGSVVKEDFIDSDNPTGDDEGYQIASAFARWVFPEASMEVYGEYSRNDHFFDTRDMLVNTMHTRAYMLGGSKKLNIDPRTWFSLNAEVTQLVSNRAYKKSGYYTNAAVPHGFRNRGQVMGAGTDTGSFSQFIKFNYYRSWGYLSFSFNRINHNSDRLKNRIVTINEQQEGNWQLHDLQETEHRWGLHGLAFLRHGLELQANIYQSRFFNRYNLHGNDVSNTRLEVVVRVQLDGFRR